MKDTEQLKGQFNECLAEFQTQAASTINRLGAYLFEKHAGLESFMWRQYTPFWCDGEQCEFHVYATNLNVVIDGETHEDMSEWEATAKIRRGEQPTPAEAATKDIGQFLEAFDAESLRRAFGDHVEVTVTKDSVTTAHCDHDES